MALPSIIAVANQKGGVAKTTTCVSLGASLAERGMRVLLIDLDPQAHLGLAVGIEPAQLSCTVTEVLGGKASLASVICQTRVRGLWLVPADQRLNWLDKHAYGRTGYEFLLKNSLDTMGDGRHDVTIIDCPPFVGMLMLNALTAAGLLIVPSQCEYYASRSLYRVLQLVQLVRGKTNPGLAYRVLITMFDRGDRVAQIIRSQMESKLGAGLLRTVIDLDPRIPESAVLGQPITVYSPQAQGAVQYRALAQELMRDEWRRA